jgi:uncharacterized protein
VRRALAAALVGVISCGGGSKLPPRPERHVTDAAAYVSPVTSARLNLDLELYERQTRHQVYVWITDKALPKHETIEDFGFNVFNAWGVGREGYDDGVVLFIFPNGDRLRMRIQVGYGLERALPDRECVRLLRASGPAMEAGKHDEGVEAIVKGIVTAIEAAR